MLGKGNIFHLSSSISTLILSTTIYTIFREFIHHKTGPRCVVLQICSLLRGGIAERGGVRVGHRIIEINGQSVVAVPHERIVNLLATSVGEVSNHLLSMGTLLKTIAHITTSLKSLRLR